MADSTMLRPSPRPSSLRAPLLSVLGSISQGQSLAPVARCLLLQGLRTKNAFCTFKWLKTTERIAVHDTCQVHETGIPGSTSEVSLAHAAPVGVCTTDGGVCPTQDAEERPPDRGTYKATVTGPLPKSLLIPDVQLGVRGVSGK